jgi:hypothetical protein
MISSWDFPELPKIGSNSYLSQKIAQIILDHLNIR